MQPVADGPNYLSPPSPSSSSSLQLVIPSLFGYSGTLQQSAQAERPFFSGDAVSFSATCSWLLTQPAAACVSGDGPRFVSALLSKHIFNADAALAASATIEHFSFDPESALKCVAADAPRSLVDVLRQNWSTPDVLVKASGALASITRFKVACGAVCTTPGVVPALVRALSAHGSSLAVCSNVCTALCAMCDTDSGVIVSVAAADGARALVATLRVQAESESAVGVLLGLLVRLAASTSSSTRDACVAAECPRALVSILGGPLAHVYSVVIFAMTALASLAEGGAVGACVTSNAASAAVGVLQGPHASDDSVRAKATAVLSAIAAFDAGACTRAEATVELVSVLRATLNTDKRVCEMTCSAIAHIAAVDARSMQELVAVGAPALLVKALRDALREDALVLSCAWACAQAFNHLSSSSANVGVLVEVGVPRALVKALRSAPDEALMTEASVSALRNISAGDSGSCVAADAPRALVSSLGGGGASISVSRPALAALENMFVGNPARKLILLEAGVLTAFVAALHGSDASACVGVLQALASVGTETSLRVALISAGVPRAIVACARLHLGHADVCDSVCGVVHSLCRESEKALLGALLDTDIARTLVIILTAHVSAPKLARTACASLLHLVHGAHGHRALVAAGAPHALVRATVTLSTDDVVAGIVCEAIRVLSLDNFEGQTACVAADAPLMLVNMLRGPFSTNAVLVAKACSALSAIAGGNVSCKSACTVVHAHRVLVRVLRAHAGNAAIVKHVACTLWALSYAGSITKAEFVSSDAPRALVELLRSTTASHAALRYAAFALWTSVSEGGGEAVRAACIAAGAPLALVETLKRCRDEVRVCEPAVGALSAISDGDDADIEACVAAGAIEALRAASERHPGTQSLCHAVEHALIILDEFQSQNDSHTQAHHASGGAAAAAAVADAPGTTHGAAAAVSPAASSGGTPARKTHACIQQ